MQKNMRISSIQMGILVLPVMIATADLLVPGISARQATQDMWLTPLVASLTGFVTVFLAFQLHRLYPGESIIQYSTRIVGTLLGKVCGFLILYDFLYSNGNIIRQYGEFIVGTSLYQTPLLAVISSMVLLCAYAVKAGLEVLARAAQVFVPALVILYAALFLLMMPFMKIEHLFPMLEHGFVPVLKGALTPQGWFSEVILFSFLLPFRREQKEDMSTGIVAVFLGMIALTGINLSTWLVMGQETTYMTYSFYNAIQLISYADFFENVDSVVIAMWVIGGFIKISLFYYAMALGTAQWLHLDDYRPLVLPLGILLVVFSLWTAPNLTELSANIQAIAGFQTTVFFTLIPLFLWVVAKLRTGKKTRPASTLPSPEAK